MIISRTPFRISFFGGGTDFPEWYLKNGGKVVSTSINKYCYISCRYLPPFFEHKYRFSYSKIENLNNFEDSSHPVIKAILKNEWKKINYGLEIHHIGDLPARSGLGSSSSFTVGLLNAVAKLKNKNFTKKKLATMAVNIERRVLKEIVGVQDQFAVSYGGFNKISFSTNGNVSIKNIDMKPKLKKKLFENLLLVFTGVSRKSSIIAKKQFDKIKYNKNKLTNMTQITNEAINIFESNKNIDQIGHLMHESWLQKKELSPFISSNLIDEMYSSAIKNGALGGKIIGAGGGGFLLLYINKEKKAVLQKLFKNYIQVPVIPETDGSKIIFNGYGQ